jgi:hypothetical protein
MTYLDQEAVQRLSKDLREAARTLSDQEVRFLVDGYYSMQKQRIVQDNRRRAMADEPHAVLDWFSSNAMFMENQVKAALDRYSSAHPMGAWTRGIVGIGPVIAAGLLAHIDIKAAPTVGHIWRFAGLDPTLKWGKGQKRPYNAGLKVLCWKLGESFKKFSGHEGCVYGHLYLQRKRYEIARDQRGEHAELCKSDLAARGPRMTAEQRAHYERGRLPPGRLDLRATRYAVKQFLSDLHGEWYRHEYGREPPLPYPIAILGHAHVRRP